MKHGFVKVAAASAEIRLADCNYNAQTLADVARCACQNDGVRVLVFPELCLTGATCGDLFYQSTLISGAKDALALYLELTADLDMISIVGLPMIMNGKLYNCAAVCQMGTLLGIVPKAALNDRGLSHDSRYFATVKDDSYAFDAFGDGMQGCTFGNRILFSCTDMPDLKIGVVIGNDTDVRGLCAAGATLICHLDATPELVGDSEKITRSISVISEKDNCAYLYANAGRGESTTDAVYAGHCLICENGTYLAQRVPFDFGNPYTCSEIDVQLLVNGRVRNTAFCNVTGNREYSEIDFSLTPCETALTRHIPTHPFISGKQLQLKQYDTIMKIQAEGLRSRIVAAHADTLVLGISGGLDSTLALLIAVDAVTSLGMPADKVLAITMPGFGTTQRTKNNATVLCRELGVSFREIPIGEAVRVHFEDIGHDPENRNVVYENSQARERTQILMDVANQYNGLVVGTGDLSESVLGWATYNGDHMSNYSVNCGIPKTLVRTLVSHAAQKQRALGNASLADALDDVVGTPVSPELLPADADGNIAQKTEDLVGPYELHDFFIYYALRYGFGPQKIYRLACYAFNGQFDAVTVAHWLKVFTRRFFTQQFKRSCMPDGPAVCDVSVSPRGSLCMPSDAAFALWTAQIDALHN